jgi:hypothetical protein
MALDISLNVAFDNMSDWIGMRNKAGKLIVRNKLQDFLLEGGGGRGVRACVKKIFSVLLDSTVRYLSYIQIHTFFENEKL